jgi:CDP-diacylglycerol--serine O-phosphatidyltransferase
MNIEKVDEKAILAVSLPKRRGVRAGIYILPNMITALSLFFGFLAIKLSIEGRMGVENSSRAFELAAYCILAAGVCDGLDGSVARLTRTQSAFGVQFDSLSDLVAFGVAPALLVYNYALHGLGRVGFAAVFVYAACGALRLAKFNVQSSLGKASGNFSGIPIPMGAAPLAVYILAQGDLASWGTEKNYPEWAINIAAFLTSADVLRYSLLGIVIVIAFGMISTFEYFSTKSIRLPRKSPFKTLAAFLALFTFLLISQFTLTLVLTMLIYVLHGPIIWLLFKRDRDAEEEELFSTDEDEEESPT